MTYIGMTYTVTANSYCHQHIRYFAALANIVMADIGMAYTVMACVVMACVVMAYVIMAYVVMANSPAHS